MILKEQNNQKKTLTDGVLAVNHEQESTPSTNGKASPLAWPFPAWPAPRGLLLAWPFPAWPAPPSLPHVSFPRVACPAWPALRGLSPRGLPRPACPAWPALPGRLRGERGAVGRAVPTARALCRQRMRSSVSPLPVSQKYLVCLRVCQTRLFIVLSPNRDLPMVP